MHSHHISDYVVVWFFHALGNHRHRSFHYSFPMLSIYRHHTEILTLPLSLAKRDGAKNQIKSAAVIFVACGGNALTDNIPALRLYTALFCGVKCFMSMEGFRFVTIKRRKCEGFLRHHRNILPPRRNFR